MLKKSISNSKSLKNIYFDDASQEEIFNVFSLISKTTGASYMSYLYENFNKKIRFAFTTNPDWGTQYVENNLIDNCHMWLNVTKAFLSTDVKKYILLWDTIKPETRKQKNIYFDRTDHEIGINGVSFCSRFNQSREILGLAPDLKTPKFQQYVSKEMDVIKNAVMQIREKLAANIIIQEKSNIILVDNYYSSSRI